MRGFKSLGNIKKALGFQDWRVSGYGRIRTPPLNPIVCINV
jgi:hypothetical protein